ncbi:hypothetical protein SAMN00808754_1462 [Thermanaeromonas toyohensis ToBE]|uniref:Uncharacterized protein n=1 Tax=Thermanaeromonas toyohensis ToBE TaxID=698762 RepID=A0A1W1VSI9_9FIRM|nr:hypothetical protein [Thermanaeromonas toyohensis]SMB96355.1 hypothetical protein SAMN00808754_1462 [Thermanaeromonas toyohensis ToBE]
MDHEWYYQKFKELSTLREQKARELEADVLLASQLRDQLREVNSRVVRNLWAHGVVLPVQMAYMKAAGDLKKAAREVREGVAAGFDRAVSVLDEVKERVDGAARKAVERAAEKEKQLAEYLEKTRKSVANSFERAKEVVTRAATEIPEKAGKAVSSAFERLASRLQAAAGRCRQVLAGYRSRVTEALEGLKKTAAAGGAGTSFSGMDVFEEDRDLVMALPEMQALRSVAFGQPYIVRPEDVIRAVQRDRQAASEDSWEAQRFRAAKEYWRIVLCQKAEERLTSYLPEEEAKMVLERLVSAEARAAAGVSEATAVQAEAKKHALVDKLLAAAEKNSLRASL